MSEQSSHPGINLGAAHPEAHAETEVKAFGFWVFLMSDLIIFGLLFATYIVMSQAQAGGPGPTRLFDLKSVAGQTALLLASSFTYGMASLALKHRSGTGALLVWLGVTAALGAGFLGLELRDFTHMANDGGVPQRRGWLSAYWALVGLHGLHLTVGLLWIAAAAAQIFIQGLTDVAKSRLLLLGLYWHFLDLIWIGIFTIVFLRDDMKADRRSEMIRYCTGALLSAALTALAFWAVMGMQMSRATTFWVIGATAIAQVLVPLRCFLHIGWHQRREDLQLILSSILMLAMMIGGSIWIMSSLAERIH